MKNRKFIFWGKLILYMLISVIIGYLLLVMVYVIPLKPINEHVRDSVKIFEREGTYPQLVNGFQDSQLDNWTDALMLLIASHEGASGSIFKQAAQNAYSKVDDTNPTESLISIYVNNSEKKEVSYARYWHGYLVFLKPLLVFCDYGEIRFLNMAFQLALMFSIMYLLTKQHRALYGIPLCIYILSLNPATLAMSMQFSSIFVLTMLSGVVLLFREKQYKDKTESVITHFLIVGCLTSYFDLLTYPLHTLAVPLILWLSISHKDRYKTVIGSAFAWIIGYGGMWAGKWIVSSVITGENIFWGALQQAAYRSRYVVSDTKFSYKDLFVRLFDAFNNQILFILLIVSLFYIIACICKHKLRINYQLLPLLSGIALMPFVWYAVLGNHSYQHAGFAFRELSITVFGLQMMVISCNKDCQ